MGIGAARLPDVICGVWIRCMALIARMLRVFVGVGGEKIHIELPIIAVEVSFMGFLWRYANARVTSRVLKTL